MVWFFFSSLFLEIEIEAIFPLVFLFSVKDTSAVSFLLTCETNISGNTTQNAFTSMSGH